MTTGETWRFKYQMLDRLRCDCLYFLGNGRRHSKYLWGQSVANHIKEMRSRLAEFPEDMKPEWLTAADIDEFEKKMLEKPEIPASADWSSQTTI